MTISDTPNFAYLQKSEPAFSNKKEQFSFLTTKASQIQTFVSENVIENIQDFNFDQLVDSINKILKKIIENYEYLSSDKIFKEDFNKMISNINSALDSYLSSIIRIKNEPKNRNNFFSRLKIDINNFKSSLSIFSSNFEEIADSISSKSKCEEDLNTRLGLECVLFNFCVKVEKIDEFPFFSSNFVRIYHYYQKISDLSQKVALLQSYCGTGKTICVPIILLCQNLKKDNKSPFILMALQDCSHVKISKMTLNGLLSKYVNITSDTNEIERIYGSYKASQKHQKLTYGLLTTYNLLPLMFNLRDNEKFISCTRFIIDQINQQTVHISVIISQIADLYNKKALAIPLNFVLLSASFPQNILKFFKIEVNDSKDKIEVTDSEDKIKVTELVENPLYDITTKNVEYEDITKINLKVEKALKKSLYKMAEMSYNGTENTNDQNNKKTENKSKQNNVETENTNDQNNKKTENKNKQKNEETENTNDQNNKKTENKNKQKNKKIEEKVEEGHILCFLPSTGQCNKLRNKIVKIKFDDKKRTNRKIVIIDIKFKPNDTFDSFTNKLCKKYKKYEEERKKEGYQHQFLYFVPIVISGVVDETINLLVCKKFPAELEKVHKLIFSTPISETFNINGLSVVIDSGLIKEEVFNQSTCLTTFNEKLASEGSKILRKGRLGRSMKGMYIYFSQKNAKIEENQTPSIQIHDLTKNYLLMKQINIDFDKINLPHEINEENLEFTKKTLIEIGAIDKENLEITNYGKEILKFDFIPIYYSAAIAKYIQRYENESDKNYAYFITAFISLIITKDRLLISDETPDRLIQFFDEYSDIVTLYKALTNLLGNYKGDLLSQQNEENHDFMKKVESYGFSPYYIKKFIKYLSEITKYLFPNTDEANKIYNSISEFVENHGIYEIINDFIDCFTENWKEIHSFQFKIARLTKTIKSPELVFLGHEKLIFNKYQTKGKIFISKRPGWKGIIVPSQCYCFNIKYNTDIESYQKYTGHLIHSKKPYEKGFDAIEYESRCIFNPWFNVLLETYFSKNIEVNNMNASSDVISFHPSRADKRIVISFVNKDNMKEKMEEAVKECLKILPFTPRSVLIYKNDIKAITEIKSIGSDDYTPMNSSFCRGGVLDKYLIHYCIDHLDELAQTKAKIRICSLFINDTCEQSEYDTKNLYIIDMLNKGIPGIENLQDVIERRYNSMKDKIKKRKRNESQNSRKYITFRFSPRLIHPSLIQKKEVQNCIMKWFNTKFPSVQIKEIKNNGFKMKLSDVDQIQKYIDKNIDTIEEEMQLEYVAFSFPRNIYTTIIKEHADWCVDKDIRTIIAKKENSEQIKNFIKEKRLQNKDKKANSYFVTHDFNPTCCCNSCINPNYSKLTDSPVIYYFENGETYSSKLCQSCIYDALCHATQTFFVENLDMNALERIKLKPQRILRMPSKNSQDGLAKWPQIPFGQLVSVLHNNDDPKLSLILSAYLNSISEFTIRNIMKKYFTFCPDHPHAFYKVTENNEIKCKVDGCENFYCSHCWQMHNKRVTCEFKAKSNKLRRCPVCSDEIEKDDGCDILKCECGTFFCFKCGEAFETYVEANKHFVDAHPNLNAFFADEIEGL